MPKTKKPTPLFVELDADTRLLLETIAAEDAAEDGGPTVLSRTIRRLIIREAKRRKLSLIE